MWFGKAPKNAKRSRTVRRVEVNLGPVLRYSREKIEFSEPDRAAECPSGSPGHRLEARAGQGAAKALKGQSSQKH